MFCPNSGLKSHRVDVRRPRIPTMSTSQEAATGVWFRSSSRVSIQRVSVEYVLTRKLLKVN